MGFAHKLRQDVTHWPISGSDGYGGFTFGTPELLSGRWEDKGELFINLDNEEVLSNAIIYLDTDVNVGDYFALGDYTVTADPTTLGPRVAFRSRNYGKVTDLAAVLALRKVWL